MPTRPIIHIGNPILWECSEWVVDIDSDETKAIIRDLEDTLIDFRNREGFGRAIAAPQIGQLRRIVFVRRDFETAVGKHTPPLRGTPLKRGLVGTPSGIPTYSLRSVGDVETAGVPAYSGSIGGALINPEIVWMSDEQMEVWDDCLSIPNLMVKVRRARQIKIAYTNEQGERCTRELEGDLSELIQHEYDHLDGILATQRAIDEKSLCTRAEWARNQQN